MNFNEIRAIENETERVNRIYDIFNEDSRLNHSKAARVEFLTTVHYIEKYLKKGDRILDIGAGAGEYSLYFARKGYEVSALELTDANIAAFRKKLTPEDSIELVQGNALDLSRYDDQSFDIVLLFGPLYHLENDADKLKCMKEAKRVCKDGGKIFFAFISNDFVFLTEFSFDVNYFSSGDYNKETFRLTDFPFVFHTVDAARNLLARGGVTILHEVASDGASELMAARINEMSDEDYAQYLRYHFYICEKPEFFGMTNHLLFVGEKDDKYQIISLRERPEYKYTAAKWFHSKWGVPEQAYLECMESYLSHQTEYGWYLCLDSEKIVGGLGVIANDFHNRKDLTPNICAVYTEEVYRCQGIAGKLLNAAVEDCRVKGISPVYLVTDHIGFYERYGWEFLCMVQGDYDTEMTRLYIHR